MTKVTGPLDGSSFTPRQVRVLKISIVIMTALLILGILALVYGMARQASRMGNAARPAASSVAAGTPYTRSLDLGQGHIESVTVSNGLLILFWKGEAGDAVLTFDPSTGSEVGRIQVSRR